MAPQTLIEFAKTIDIKNGQNEALLPVPRMENGVGNSSAKCVHVRKPSEHILEPQSLDFALRIAPQQRVANRTQNTPRRALVGGQDRMRSKAQKSIALDFVVCGNDGDHGLKRELPLHLQKAREGLAAGGRIHDHHRHRIGFAIGTNRPRKKRGFRAENGPQHSLPRGRRVAANKARAQGWRLR